MAGKNQITGGAFQDAEGNRLAYGFLTFQLSSDAQESTDPGQIVGGVPVVVPLDQNGNVAGTVLIWPNDQLAPANTFYVVNAFNQQGEFAWLSQQNLIIPSTPSPYNLGTAIPQGVPGTTPNVLLQTNGVNNAVQNELNLVAGSGMTVTNSGAAVTFASSSLPINWHGAGCSGNTSVINAFATEPSNVSLTSVIDATATEPAYYQLVTGSSSNSQAQFYDNGSATPHQKEITLGLLSATRYRVQLVSTTNQRVWIGMTDSASATGNLVADNPNQNMAAFRYSTHAGDTNWMCYCSTSSGSFTAISSGVAADTNGHAFLITYKSGSVIFSIDGNQVASISTNVPTTSTLMQNAINVDNINLANSISLNVAYSYWATTV